MFGHYGSHSHFHRLKAPGRWLPCFYALYFALFLPLICWGTLAEPGHPHALPHFVFTNGTDHSAVEPAHESNSAESASQTPAAEQSQPDTSAIVLLTLILVSLISTLGPPTIRFVRLHPFLFCAQPLTLVPTPPPRAG